MLTEADRALISDPARNFPFVCGFQEQPNPVSTPPPGTGTSSRRYWCAVEGVSIAEAFTGDVFTDGSCFKDGPVTFHAAGWAALKVTPTGELFVALWGAVGADYPQTSPAAEHIAVLAVMQYCPNATLIYSDFLGLVKLTDEPWWQITPRHHVYAGLQIQIRGAPTWTQDFCIVKVPAHVKPDELPAGSPEW